MRFFSSKKTVRIVVAVLTCLSSMTLFSSKGVVPVSFDLSQETSNNPVITEIEPASGSIGTIVTIIGRNFGEERKDCSIMFADSISCKDYDFDYMFWSDSVIQVKVPTGAIDGTVSLVKDGAHINGPQFTVEKSVNRTYSEPMDVTIDYSLFIHSITEYSHHPLYIWLPSAVPSDTQRAVTGLEKSDNCMETQNDELDLFNVGVLVPGNNYLVQKRFSYTSYTVETDINPEEVSSQYDKDSDFYRYYTKPQYAIEADNPWMIETAKRIVGEETNPYNQARLIYDWVVASMDYQYPPPNRDWRAITALRTHRGDCAVYSFLFIALCRSLGIPARAVAGHVIFINEQVSMHFWAEFYLPEYGWIPVDANYGDVQVDGFKPKEFYFGNMDNRHIAFSKGKVDFRLLNEDGDEEAFTLTALQKYHSYIKNKPEACTYTIDRNIRRVMCTTDEL